jgi:hypothetical protein
MQVNLAWGPRSTIDARSLGPEGELGMPHGSVPAAPRSPLQDFGIPAGGVLVNRVIDLKRAVGADAAGFVKNRVPFSKVLELA